MFLYTAKKIISRITNGNIIQESRGTGFFVKKGDKIVFVTNRHMIEPGYGDKKLKGYKTFEFLIESYQSFDEKGLPSKLNSGIVHNINDFVVADNPLNDVACLADVKIRDFQLTISAYIEYDLLADKSWFENKLSVCDTIAYPGFPEWFDVKNNTPIFRMGTIASDPRFDYANNALERNMLGAARVAYEGFSSGGSSGSPVFAIQKGFPTGAGISAPEDFFREVKVVGMNAGHFNTYTVVKSDDSGEYIKVENVSEEYADGGNGSDKSKSMTVVGHSGISFFYKSSVIKEVIDRLC